MLAKQTHGVIKRINKLAVYEGFMFRFRTNFSHFDRCVSSFGNVNKVVLPSVLLQLLKLQTRFIVWLPFLNNVVFRAYPLAQLG